MLNPALYYAITFHSQIYVKKEKEKVELEMESGTSGGQGIKKTNKN